VNFSLEDERERDGSGPETEMRVSEGKGGPQRASWLRSRGAATVGLLASGGLGLLSRSGRLPPWEAKYLGVALWACALYWLLRVAAGSAAGRPKVALFALLGGWFVEFMQITPIPRWISAKHWLLRVVFGEWFSPYDLPAYAAGVVLGFVADALVAGILTRHPLRLRS
jgi:hypothetical protein